MPLPSEARDGLMRAWLEILREKHPQVAWLAIRQDAAAVTQKQLTEDERPVLSA